MAACGCSGICNCSTEEINFPCTPQVPPPNIPYCEPTVIEEVCPRVNVNNRRAAFTTAQNFNLPLCGESTIIFSNDLPIIHVGAFIWSSAYGYLEIIGSTETSLTVTNRCLEGNAPTGTQVPKGSTFIETVDPTFANRAEDVFLAVDFTVPPDGVCVQARFTSMVGIPLGAQVSFGGGTYWLTFDFGGGLVQLCNLGSGGTPGTLLTATDSAGNFQYPVTVVSNSIVLENENTTEELTYDVGTEESTVNTFLTFTNPYSNKPLSIFYRFVGVFNGEVTNKAGPPHGAFSIARLDTAINGIVSSKTEQISLNSFENSTPYDKSFELVRDGVLLLPPGETAVISTNFYLNWVPGASALENFVVGIASIRATAIGIFPG